MKIKVGLGSCGIAAGANKTYSAIKDLFAEKKIDIEIHETGCIGACYNEPIVEVYTDDDKHYVYGGIHTERAQEFVERAIEKKEVIKEWLMSGTDEETGHDSYFRKQVKIALRNTGVIDPKSIDDYLERDGYKGLKKAVMMSSEEIIKTVLDAGLRGRGGAGFPTGLKWKFAANSPKGKKYMICNADEGDPGAFMDRSVLESDPHAVIEGMIIGAIAIGADEGYIYCRAEYPKAIENVKIAIKQAKEKNLLGDNILGTEYSFNLKLKEGAGAFVCGEETALMASIEGQRGMPRIRPPYPAEAGLWGKPSNVNNVETFSNVPWIIYHGADKYNQYGTENSKGTKVFALAGKVKRGGLVEVPMGITIREVIYDIAGGIKDGKKFKAVQMGGPSGGCIPEEHIDTPIDYDSLNAKGAIMGSGGMVVADETNCMVDLAKFFLNFTQNESCGKCTFCRIGTKRMLEILTRITEGEGKEGDIELLEELAKQIISTSLCGLGQSAPNPVLTTIKYFRDEYEAHIKDKKCPSKSCKALLTFTVNDNCIGCTRCARVCPVEAISGQVKEKHVIDMEKCIKCGTCVSSCKFNAIDVE